MTQSHRQRTIHHIARFEPLALRVGICDGGGMANPDQRKPTGGGFILAASILIGALAGMAFGEASAGFIAGAAVGVAILILLWWRERR